MWGPMAGAGGHTNLMLSGCMEVCYLASLSLFAHLHSGGSVAWWAGLSWGHVESIKDSA